MNKVFFFLLWATIIGCTTKETESLQHNIIPYPFSLQQGSGFFNLKPNTPIVTKDETRGNAEYLASVLQKGFRKEIVIKSKGKGIVLTKNNQLEERYGKEGYILRISPKGILIEGATNAGLFYGIQSLRQMLPANFESNSDTFKKIPLPCLEITDFPRFGWRAFLLDEARHFKGVEAVKDLLDEMALLKMNTFHWHLTDDQGWRIEIKKYPLLTEKGSYRKDTQTSTRSTNRRGEPHGGFYTQKEIQDIIQYAMERHIQIIPEIEMPGHASAAIAAYPWLGVLGDTIEVPEVFGKLPDSFNVTDIRVIEFLQDVLMEVFELFPGKIVHIGGDEVMFDTWRKSPVVLKFIQENNLSSTADLQIYFTNRMSNFIDSFNHRMMGWNEILGVNIHEWNNSNELQPKQELAKSAIIHFWKGDINLMKDAVSGGYDVVNALHSETYLDYSYESLPLSRAYAFEPVPERLDKAFHHKVLGLSCQMWSEWIPAIDDMERQVFPRLAAYAEVGWTQKDKRSFTRFQSSLNNLLKRWDHLNINYAIVEE